ncbi:unnamed protein product [Moneuplotes crassus]|uniref:Uncharacterized protein n=1 Tax=Euplotes crassus TaxID=5936 RepID=A0AAD1Y191_EUPCR|nr:unnamed protein product [Moneuplotes crassus]
MFILSRKIQKIKKGSTQKGNEVNDSCLLNKKLVACAQNLKKHVSHQNSKERPKVFFSRRPSKHLQKQKDCSKEHQDYPNDQTLTSGSKITGDTKRTDTNNIPEDTLNITLNSIPDSLNSSDYFNRESLQNLPSHQYLQNRDHFLRPSHPQNSVLKATNYSEQIPALLQKKSHFNSCIRHIKTGLSSRRSSKSALGMKVLSQSHKGSRNIALKSSLTSKITQSFQKNSRKKKGNIKTKRVSLTILRSEEKLIIFRNHLPNKREILTDKLSNKLNSIYFKYYKSGYEPYDKEKEESQERSSSKMFTPKRSKKSIKKRRSSKKVTNPKHASGKLTSKLKSVIKTLNKYENSLRSESQ